jgi:serine/threonine-protein kinase
MATPTSSGLCAQCGAPLTDKAAFCMRCGAATGAPPPPETDILGRLQAALVGRYQVERELGRGGMATVFLAQDVKHERPVALKVLHPELAASMGAERFDREIKLAARLHHPHILSLYDSGSADGLLYYVMPFVQGESLRDRLNRDQMLPVDEAIQVTLEVADALGAAHALGIVHRDIKPENIMLSGGHALVADFGVARAVSSAGAQKLTQTGMAVGTPLYMSPEQSLGDEVGPTSDLYSLACVAYEMLTGQPPFTGANARAIMARHTMEAVPSITLVRDAVPHEVESAILIALAKVPADRPQTSGEFAALLHGEGKAGATRSIGSRLTATRRQTPVATPRAARRRALWMTLAGILLVAGAAGGWWVIRGRRAAASGAAGGLDPHRLAVLYFEDRSPRGQLSYLADGLTEGLIGALRDVQGLDVVSRGGVEPFRGTALPRDSIARALGTGTLVLGSVEPDGQRIRVTVRLVDGNSGTEFQSASFDQPAGRELALADTLASQASLLVRAKLGEEIRLRRLREGTQNPNAWSLLQRAERARKDGEAADDTVALIRAFATADSFAAQAERLDPRWPDPIVLRGLLDYRRSRLYGGDPPAADPWIHRGLGHMERALAADASNPDALELRGNLRYWRWLLGLETNRANARALLEAAQGDLESATRLKPSQAGAWATLSHLYYQTASNTKVNYAAQRAWEADAYLGNADVILQRLFYSSYDLEQFSDARHWCEVGSRRFPANPKFVECRLWLMTTRLETAPDPARAWKVRDSILAVTAPRDTAWQGLNSQLMVAAVLARAGRLDSARHLVQRSRGTPDVDPTRDLAYLAAFVDNLLGDRQAAMDELTTFLAANPNRRQSLADEPGWWFKGLDSTRAWRQVVGQGR